jgi:hypothetical protein
VCKHPDRSERFLLFWAIRHFEWQLKIVLVPAAPNESAVKGVKSLGERERESKSAREELFLGRNPLFLLATRPPPTCAPRAAKIKRLLVNFASRTQPLSETTYPDVTVFTTGFVQMENLHLPHVNAKLIFSCVKQENCQFLLSNLKQVNKLYNGDYSCNLLAFGSAVCVLRIKNQW